ncbi:hypothetical protein [Parasitella parasitica]|uniref:DUF4939 domain-containing protein n=1 Tax=Parasitella parasitica TaxID=35722 RepID=A0A0B7NAR6_9FUNG|nr:hypothetical protein [Parasitella parasitica]
MAQCEIAIKNLGAEIQEFMDTKVVLKANLHEENKRVAALHREPTPSAPVTPNPPASAREVVPSFNVKIKEPNVFSGKTAYCNSFFSQLFLVYTSDPARFETDRSKIIYAISYMSGVAFQYMEPYLQQVYSDDKRST